MLKIVYTLIHNTIGGRRVLLDCADIVFVPTDQNTFTWMLTYYIARLSCSCVVMYKVGICIRYV